MSAREVIALALRGHQKWVDDDMPADETACCADAVLDALSRDGYAVVAAAMLTRLESQLAAAQAAQYTAQAQASHR